MKRNHIDQTVPMICSGRQQGAALAVSLVLLVIVTLVGLAGMRGTILQERMAGGAYDRETAFQAAEAALLLGEQAFADDPGAWIDVIDDNDKELDCSRNTCTFNPSGQISEGLWTSVTGGSVDEGFAPIDASNPPQFVVQLLGPCSSGLGGGFTGTTDQNEGGPKGAQLTDQGTCYRITARAIDPTEAMNAERAQVFLQSTYRM